MSELFYPSPAENLLPSDGEVFYFHDFLTPKDAYHWFGILRDSIQWTNDEVVLFGKKHITKRKVAWYGDAQFEYRYSNSMKKALPWTADLLRIKSLAEDICKTQFNSCLLNLYHDGSEGMGYHSDDEKELGINPIIASVSLGAVRKFFFRHKSTGERITVLLDDGSLLLMQGKTQHRWVHSLPKASTVKQPRINLTFRQFIL